LSFQCDRCDLEMTIRNINDTLAPTNKNIQVTVIQMTCFDVLTSTRESNNVRIGIESYDVLRQVYVPG
jgi:hypothetical protein